MTEIPEGLEESEKERIIKKLRAILERREKPTDVAYEGDFEGSYTYYDDEDIEALEDDDF